jgi:hypothetical protein
MSGMTRRELLSNIAGASIASASGLLQPLKLSPLVEAELSPSSSSSVDFRYAPKHFQTAFCLPDDRHKSLADESGRLLYDFPDNQFASIFEFGTVIEFSLAGMEPNEIRRHWIESASTPIIHTLIERSNVSFELIQFATKRAEGRVDNVILRISAKHEPLHVSPQVRIHSCLSYQLSDTKSPFTIVTRNGGAPWLYCLSPEPKRGEAVWWKDAAGFLLYLEQLIVESGRDIDYLFRLPQESCPHLDTSCAANSLLQEARDYWSSWKPYGNTVRVSLNGRHEEFLVASARNIQQAREEKNGQLVFQVGPTVYRGLWIVDGNFLLEAARYLGYDAEADAGLRSEWKRQLANGQIVAGGGGAHWKDTAIAMFTLVRACELKQDWSLLRELAPQVRLAIEFLKMSRDKARRGKSDNGRYGLLEPGFPDGGIGGEHSEFSNTLWTLAGLQAIARCNRELGIRELNGADSLYRELRASFDAAAAREMVSDPRGFKYLPILMASDPDWQIADAWARPRPQTAQWGLSHAIFPGEIFAKDDPIVRGHIALMQSIVAEDVPAETGWLKHESLWTYNAPFVAQVYLWAGQREWAHRTFEGFLNHASPLYCWREEQPLQHALVSQYWGDMPHNWASAECIRYLRHRLVLEDGDSLRLLCGLVATELDVRQPIELHDTPTRFGRVSLRLQPTAKSGWRLEFQRDGARAPKSVEITADIFHPREAHIAGASFRRAGDRIAVDSDATKWTVTWQ